METWLTPNIAIGLMLIGVAPTILILYLLYPSRKTPGVLWFLVAVAGGGAWSLTYGLFTLVDSPRLTLMLANFFWPIIPLCAVSMFLLSYEFVFRRTVSRKTAVAAYVPVMSLFILVWVNPGDLIFTGQYYVTAEGYLHFPAFGGPLKVLLMQVYGYLLVLFAAGIFVGELLRSTGLQRKQTMYLVLMFVSLIVASTVKVLELVPMYFDPTPTVFTFTGLLFAYSIYTHGSLRFVPTARELAFENIEDPILILNRDLEVIDTNVTESAILGPQPIGAHVSDILPHDGWGGEDHPEAIQLEHQGRIRHFDINESTYDFGRGLQIYVLLLGETTELREREQELDQVRMILSRVLRHNIRNAMLVINGHVELIQTRGDSEVEEFASKINRRAETLQKQVRKARMLEEVIDDKSFVIESLAGVVDDAVASAKVNPAVRIHTDVEDVEIEVHPKLRLAVQETIENAVEHHDSPQDAELDMSTDITDCTVTLLIEDNGPGIPAGEIEVIDQNEETDLEHVSGIGLWLIRWIVDRSNGDLTIDSCQDGSRVCMTFPLLSRDDVASDANGQTTVSH